MDVYYDAKEMLKHELHEIVERGEISPNNLEMIDKLLNAIKNSCKIIMYEEYAEDGYSYADGDHDMSDYSYARGRGRNAKRDSLGRYSREGGYSSEGGYSNARRGRYSRGGYSYADGDKHEKIEMLRGMMNEVSSEEERRAINNIIKKMEKE
jgi:hypothetical protein